MPPYSSPQLTIANPDTIRAESLTYEKLVISIFLELNKKLGEPLLKPTYQEMSAIEARVRFADAILAPYYDADYNEAVEALETEMEECTSEGGGGYGMPYFKILMKWVKAMTTCWSKVNILAPSDSTRILGGDEIT